MKLLNNLMSFDIYKIMNEDLSGSSQRRSDKIFSSKGEITLSDGTVINAADIVNVVQQAVTDIKLNWLSFYKFAKGATIFYTYNNPRCQTMYVNSDLQIHVSANFIYHVLKMDVELVEAILMHEIFHIIYDHLNRGNNWLSANGLPLTPKNHHDNNLAADIEVNATLVNKNIISYNRLANEVHGLFLKKATDDYENNYINVVSMENILGDEEAMNRLRKMAPFNEPPEGPGGNEGGSSGGNGNESGNEGGSSGGQESGNEGGNESGSSNGNGNESGQEGGTQSNKSSGQGGTSDNGKKGITSSNGGGNKSGHIDTIGEYGDSRDARSKGIIANDKTYTEEERRELEKIRKEASIRNTKSELEKRKREFVNSLSKNDAVRKIIEKAAIDSKQYENLWKKILERFLNSRTRQSAKLKGKKTDWKNKHRLANGMYGINRPKEEDFDPQDINLYIDVSGSMDVDLMSIICESLIVLCEKYKYTAINIIPWADKSGNIYKIDALSIKGKEQTTKEIIDVLENAPNECGGGTMGKATSQSICKVCAQSLMDPRKKTKDDVHIIITDGYIYGIETIENDIYNDVAEVTNSSIANRALKNTIWMVYDNNDKKSIEDNIKNGKLLFISSDLVKKQK